MWSNYKPEEDTDDEPREVITISIFNESGQTLDRDVLITNGQLPEGYYSDELQSMVDRLNDNSGEDLFKI